MAVTNDDVAENRRRRAVASNLAGIAEFLHFGDISPTG
jgi:hypothetical protein